LSRSVAKSLPASENEIAVFLASAVDTDPDAFVDAVRHPEALWKAPKVPRVQRFSMPPRPADVEDIQLDPRDLEAIRRCVPGDCEVKLTASEIRRLQIAPSIQLEFRRLIFDRVARYLERGVAGTGALHDHARPLDQAAISAELLIRSPWLTERAPGLAQYVEDFPSARLGDVHSFIYWLETDHTPKPTIQVVHVMIARHSGQGIFAPEVVVVSRQVFASHYINGSLAVSVLFRDRTKSRRYLAYANRLHVDGLNGWLGGLRRLLIERSVRGRGAAALDKQRQRIEAWNRF
jgi:hypothetical protein